MVEGRTSGKPKFAVVQALEGGAMCHEWVYCRIIDVQGVCRSQDASDPAVYCMKVQTVLF